jgi:hypothetical protein
MTPSLQAANIAIEGNAHARPSHSPVKPTPETEQPSALLSLPPELRNRIYEFALADGIAINMYA